jgi:hypothetical protein
VQNPSSSCEFLGGKSHFFWPPQFLHRDLYLREACGVVMNLWMKQ